MDKLIDNPIQSESDDSLALAPYAKALAEFIRETESPLTIGIQGGWGTGKTSLLRMVEEGLKGKQGRTIKTPCLYINTWQYAQFGQEHALPFSVFNGLIQAIRREFDFPEDRDKLNALANGLTRAAKLAMALGTGYIKEKTGVSLEVQGSEAAGREPMIDEGGALLSIKQTFKDLVEVVLKSQARNSPKDKLVIMVDDLDRVRPVRALELLETLKNFADVPGCVFVLAVDYSVIQQGVGERLGRESQATHSKLYFDKIIQVPFNMPLAAYKLDMYLMGLLGWNLAADPPQMFDDAYLPAPTREFREHVPCFERLTRRSVGSNPRAIKRVISYVRLLRLLRDEGASRGDRWNMALAKILYALACMHTEWPEAFALLAATPSPELLMQLRTSSGIEARRELDDMWKRLGAPQQSKRNFQAFCEEFISAIDEDGDGNLTVQEFRQVWQILKDTRLTSAELLDADALFRPVDDLFQARNLTSATAAMLARALRASHFNDPLSLRMDYAEGQTFVTLVWRDATIGSIVALKRGAQFYCQSDRPEALLREEPLTPYLSPADVGHRGSGNLRLDIEELCLKPEPVVVDVLNRLHAAIVPAPPDRPRPPWPGEGPTAAAPKTESM